MGFMKKRYLTAHRDIADKTKQLRNAAQQSTVPELLVPVCYVPV